MVDSSTVRITGPLAPYRDSFWAELLVQGYTPLSSANQLRLMAHFSRWLARERLQPQDLRASHIDEFLQHRRGAGYTCWRSPRGMVPMLRHLRHLGVVPPEQPAVDAPSPLDILLREYEHYLLKERALTSATVRQYLFSGRSFLSTRFNGQTLDLGRLRAADVISFVLRESRSSCAGSAKLKVTALRSLLRFLHLRGDVDASLATAVPAVAGRRLAGLPSALAADEAQRLLRSCDRRRPVGRRDYTALLLMVRLGLRAGEVAGLALDDLDWTTGELVVRGKPGREDRLPLPRDVGEAIVSYLLHARPRSTSRRVFLGTRAPFSRLTRSAVSFLVRRAGRRCGLASVSAHHLRHTAATQMLRHGASLSEIAQVLRHRRVETTAIYTKVDRDRLRELARPWPGATP